MFKKNTSLSAGKVFTSFSAIVFILFFSFFVSSCKTDTTVESSGSSVGFSSNPVSPNQSTSDTTIISGTVIGNISGIPIDSAHVLLIGGSTSLATSTDNQGKFSFKFNLSTNTNFTIFVTKSGYVIDTTVVPFPIVPGSSNTLDPIKMNYPTSGTGSQGPSGNPISIALLSQTATSIGVQSSGSVETAGLTFVVLDSAGMPIDLNHTVKVNFFIEAQPNGGESLSPTSVFTNDIGQATVNLTSGTKAGTVQIRAEIDLPNGKTIFSDPVAVAITGGLPDYNHFSIATNLVNIPGIIFQKYSSFVTAFVGDKYANPVRVGTSVYFTSTGGIIQGSAITDKTGIASADFIVANPNSPVDPILGKGFATIYATTADENKNNITTSTSVLFSMYPHITVSDTSAFDIPNGGSKDNSYTVSDDKGNPLTSGTQITVSVDVKNVATQGDVNITLPDTQDKRWTRFHFTVLDAADTVVENNKCTITIKSVGANGQASTQFSGYVH
jgi:hypothetical protein